MRDSLEDLLGRLRREIDKARAGDADRDELARLVGEVDRRLAEGEEVHAEAGVGEELRDSVRHFEASHPELAAAVGRVADAFGSIGL